MATTLARILRSSGAVSRLGVVSACTLRSTTAALSVASRWQPARSVYAKVREGNVPAVCNISHRLGPLTNCICNEFSAQAIERLQMKLDREGIERRLFERRVRAVPGSPLP